MAYTFRLSWPPLTRQFTAFYQFAADEQTILIGRIAEGDATR
jgi:hypothetical protein